MKILISLVLALLLCGCVMVPQEPTVPSIETLPPIETTVETTVPTEPEPEPKPLMQYPLSDTCIESMTVMGEDLITAALDEKGQNTLIRLAAPEYNPIFETPAKYYVDLSADTTVVCGEAMGIMDWNSLQYILMDGALQETDRISLPDDLSGIAHISGDLKTIYYCTTSGLWRMDVSTRDVRQLAEAYDPYGDMSVMALLFDDQVVQCSLNGALSFYDSSTGELLKTAQEYPALVSWDDTCYWTEYNGIQELLIGQKGSEEIRQFYPNGFGDSFLLPSLGGVMTLEQDASVTLLDFYTLPDGHRTASIQLPTDAVPGLIAAGTDAIWVLDNPNHTLYRWNLTLSDPKDSAVYVNRHFTADSTDPEGLALVKAEAAKLSQKHRVEILVGDQVDSIEIPDYKLTSGYQVPLFRKALKDVDQVLSSFPQGMLRSASGLDQPFIIALAFTITGTEENTLPSAGGLHSWFEGRTAIIVAMEDNLRYALYHELEHMIDSYIFGNTSYFDDWNSLNPDGFTYSFQYTDYWQNDVTEYLENDRRYFIDDYSTTYPNEDRARIFEYAVQPDCGFYFESPYMQEKLSVLCQAIRDTFQLDPAETMLWEQYLR